MTNSVPGDLPPAIIIPDHLTTALSLSAKNRWTGEHDYGWSLNLGLASTGVEVPVAPSGQTQLKESSLSKQDAPFLQG